MPSHLLASDSDDDSVHTLDVVAGDAVDAQLRYEIRSPSGDRYGGTFYSDLDAAVSACKTANTGPPTSWYVVIPVIHANP